jgi:hypothetical protein
MPKTMPKKKSTYTCVYCAFTCSKQSNYNKHILTQKHLKNINDILKLKKRAENAASLQCDCGRSYKHNSGLWRHKKTCDFNNNNNNNNNNIIIINEEDKKEIIEPTTETIILDASANEIKVLTNLVLELVKSNTELQKQMLEVCKNSQPNNTTIHNNNKTFNLQFFLNEQCKDAMNVSEFVNSVQLNLEDLERVGRQGYVDGISHIILSKLKETDIYKRPFHCSDAKRETLYVKDTNGWEREGADNLKMIKAVKDVGQKNFSILNEYRVLHPDCLQADSEYNDKYVQMMIQAAGSQKDNVNKVIKKIAKEIVISK